MKGNREQANLQSITAKGGAMNMLCSLPRLRDRRWSSAMGLVRGIVVRR